MSSWTFVEDHWYFGDAYIADLGPYTGPWPPHAPAIKMGSTPALDTPNLEFLDCVVGLLNPSGLISGFADDTYPTDITDAYRYLTGAGGSATSLFYDQIDGSPGDFSAPPPGAHLVISWSGNIPSLTPEQVAPSGYSATAAGPAVPNQAQGKYSDWNPAVPEDRIPFAGYGREEITAITDDRTFEFSPVPRDRDVAAGILAEWTRAVTSDPSCIYGEHDNTIDYYSIDWATDKDFNHNEFGFGIQVNGTLTTVNFRSMQFSQGIDTSVPGGVPPQLMGLHAEIDYAVPPLVDGTVDAGFYQYQSDAAAVEVKSWSGNFVVTSGGTFYVMAGTDNDLGPGQGGTVPLPDWPVRTLRLGFGSFADLSPTGFTPYPFGTEVGRLTPPGRPAPDPITGNIPATRIDTPVTASIDVSMAGTAPNFVVLLQHDAMGSYTFDADNYAYPPGGQERSQSMEQQGDLSFSTAGERVHVVIPPWRYFLLNHEFYLRMTQRNDGLGIAQHPRLPTMRGSTSTQTTKVPRVGGKNTYS